ncbi:MAG: lipocalin-like domain-containing protein [Pseudomonadota bacterium]
MQRRRLLQWLLLGGGMPLGSLRAAPPEFPAVVPRRLAFPPDHGAHPDYRTEWWYITGWLEAGSEEIGFQVTFFRSRTTHDPANPSRFAPHQLLFAHAAVARPSAAGRLLHDQRVARVVRGDAANRFDAADTDLLLEGWSLRRNPDDSYVANIGSETLRLDLHFVPTQPLLLQGEGGYSRKGPLVEQASHYYSRPHLAVSGRIATGGDWLPARGRAWLDHEWSSKVLDEAAVGWDWIGINLADGGALMVFRIRSRSGDAVRWAAARLRTADGRERSFGSDEVRFEPLATWRSPHTGTIYPTHLNIHLGSGSTALRYEIRPLMDDQELDARRSTGAVYWEGAVSLWAEGRQRGRGYLELVGYHRPMKL